MSDDFTPYQDAAFINEPQHLFNESIDDLQLNDIGELSSPTNVKSFKKSGTLKQSSKVDDSGKNKPFVLFNHILGYDRIEWFKNCVFILLVILAF